MYTNDVEKLKYCSSNMCFMSVGSRRALLHKMKWKFGHDFIVIRDDV